MTNTNDPLFIIVDLFCGAGGTTTGFVQAVLDGRSLAKVIACVNHDAKAIKSHWRNHPDVKHFEEDIRTLDLGELVKLVDLYRIKYPSAFLVLWASLECTNFSKAKGGQPRDADSRTLADHLDRYVIALNPDYIQIENVVEFMSWGPLISRVLKTIDGFDCCELTFIETDVVQYNHMGDPIIQSVLGDASRIEIRTKKGWRASYSGHPESRKNGQDWLRWRQLICSHGYVDQWKELNSANYGAYTSRNRLFGVFAKDGLPIAFPEPTHAKVPSKFSMHGDLKKWMAVKEVLNFDDEGESIFTRKKPLSDKTLERIYAGLQKYIAKGDTAFISKYFSGRPKGKVNSVNDPSPTVTTFGGNSLVQTMNYADVSVDSPAGTITTIDHHALVQADFLLKYNSTDKNGKHTPPSIEDPCPVVSTQVRLGLIQPKFLVQRNTGDPKRKIVDIDGPARTITTTGGNQELVSAEFLAAYYGNGDNVSSVDSPCPVIPTKDRFGLVEPVCLLKYDSTDKAGKHYPPSLDNPAPVIITQGRLGLIQTETFIMPTNYDNTSKSVDEPSPTLTASRRHPYLIGATTISVESPERVVVTYSTEPAKGFLEMEGSPIVIAIYETDSDICLKIKQFMVVYGLVDIKMRMLRVPELLKIQGFPAEYKLEGNQSDQKKFIGNSVVPHVVKAWTEAMAMKIIDFLKRKVA